MNRYHVEKMASDLAATRHELWRPILYHAWHTAVWMVVFMGVIFAVLFAVSWTL